ncbi:esterase-like activity of phytase family protein [Roseiarcaceae bacterium H3SJ34-1]|uniref:esterase-like activity of phytase family protein n=1 Tax=Terripilifer ovatus TaxID=3032367 RepID=UPI003AB9828F|nr:esterase-like activity of phytase family protein [Roseiarcaceae bacterium H3SJ34-1]
MVRSFAFVSLSSVLLAISASAQTIETRVLTTSDPKIVTSKAVELPNGKSLVITVGVGSGAARHRNDPPDVVWTIGDRGPNMTCSEAPGILGEDIAQACRKLTNGRIYPTPDYVPSIYKLELDRAAGSFKLLETIPLRKAKSGATISGLLNPQTKASKDTGLDLSGKTLPDDPDNVDLEGIVRLTDGTFWIGEEMGPSIAHVAADGKIIERHVPVDAAEDYKNAEAKIVADLPAILSKRQGNRGIEGVAISPDEAFLYFMVQNPLANPDAKAYQNARNTRFFKFDLKAGKLVGEWIYQLADPQSFGFDPSPRQSEPRISEITALGLDRILVDERTEKTTKLFEITLNGATNILGSKWDEVATAPSLEQQNDLDPLSVTPVTKMLRFDTFRDGKGAPEKIEGMAILEDGSLLLINDNDFGIRGDATKIVIVKGAVEADPAIWKK